MTLIINEIQFLKLTKVISGGQTGADRGGIDAAFDLNVDTGGTAPKDYRTSRGNDLTLKDLNLEEDISFAYPPRTLKNVKNSDGTVIIGTRMDSPGSVLTNSYCIKQKKPSLHLGFSTDYSQEDIINAAEKLVNWIRKKQISILNVAGNRDGNYDNVHYELTYKVIQTALLNLYNSNELTVKEL